MEILLLTIYFQGVINSKKILNLLFRKDSNATITFGNEFLIKFGLVSLKKNET